MWIWILIILILIIGILVPLILNFITKENDRQKSLTFVTNNANNFIDAKTNYLELHQKESYSFKEVKNIDTNRVRKSGIYALYFKNQEISEIVPIYIGQAKDIRSRWKEHIYELNKVQKGESNSRKYSKILHYMLN